MTTPGVLIVEDDPQLGTIFSIALRNDFEVMLCVDGQGALTQLSRTTPELVVLDLHLPGASGQEILSYIRADIRLAKTKVILATADHLQAELLQEHTEIVLLKPISPIQLRELAVRLCKTIDNPPGFTA